MFVLNQKREISAADAEDELAGHWSWYYAPPRLFFLKIESQTSRHPFSSLRCVLWDPKTCEILTDCSHFILLCLVCAVLILFIRGVPHFVLDFVEIFLCLNNLFILQNCTFPQSRCSLTVTDNGNQIKSNKSCPHYWILINFLKYTASKQCNMEGSQQSLILFHN